MQVAEKKRRNAWRPGPGEMPVVNLFLRRVRSICDSRTMCIFVHAFNF